MKNTLALSAAAIALLITLGAPAEAAYVVDLTQVVDKSQPLGFDVVAKGSGTIDTTGLHLLGPISGPAQIEPFDRVLITGPAMTFTTGGAYSGFTGPTSFGGNSFAFASSGSGDFVGIFFAELLLPEDYMSGSPLSDTSTYDNATFASLAATPGTYKWTFGTGAHADSFTLKIGPTAVIPEPSTWALMGFGFAGLAFAGWRARRRSVAVAG